MFFGSLLLFLCISLTSQQDRKNAVGFLFTIPKTVVSGSNETVCLSIHAKNMQLPIKTTIDVKFKGKHFPVIKNLESLNSCFALEIPKLRISEASFLSVKVQLRINGVMHSYHNLDPILVYPSEQNHTFIDCDKSFYKPGDLVLFRVLVLDSNLLPINHKVSSVKIRNPSDIIVALWKDKPLNSGLLQLEYQLVKESLIGKWRIEVGTTSKTFEVFKYSLPRFKVTLQHAKQIFHGIQELKVQICGQYSFNQPVSGIAFLKVTNSKGSLRPLIRSDLLQSGCVNFTLTNHDLELHDFERKFKSLDTKLWLHLTGTVTEKGTNKIHLTSTKILVLNQAYSMKFLGKSTFQPGLPYKGRLFLGSIHDDISDDQIEICYNVAVKKSWNYLNNEQCSNFTVGLNTTLDFTILPLKSNVIHVQLKARSKKYTNIVESFLLIRLFSPSASYLVVENRHVQPTECKSTQEFIVTFTADHFNDNETITFYYLAKTYNKLNKLRRFTKQVKKSTINYEKTLENRLGSRIKHTKLNGTIDWFNLSFKIDRKSLSRYQLLLYYINSASGETVATTKTVFIRPCSLNVTANWSKNRTTPGDLVTLSLKTGGNALCSVSSTDKSTSFMSNSLQSLNFAGFAKLFNFEGPEAPVSSRKACLGPDKKIAALELFEENTRRRRHVFNFAEDFDAYDTFSDFGTVVITDLKLITKNCYTGPYNKKNNEEAQFLTGQYEEENEESKVEIRHEFPETWLWELVPVSGSVELTRQLPHSITSFTTNILCSSSSQGIGFSKELELTVFQSFFIEVLAPYSIKREEYFYLYVKIFNYLNYAVPVKVSLRMTNGLQLRNSKDKLQQSYCAHNNTSVTHVFALIATEMGVENVSVVAEVDNQYPATCGPETVISRRDKVYKTILVEPEGFQMTKTKSVLLCSKEESSEPAMVSWDLKIPKELIEGTVRSSLQLNGDLLSKSIENLEDLLNIPQGCGEQIMSSMAPNLYILKYLNATNRLSNSLRQRIVRNLKIGYQRICNYLHKDGSFSAFGYHDSSGSMFLTSFVVKVLQQAKELIYVDQRVVSKAVSWIFDHQLENGCFNTMHHVFQDMGGTSTENSTAGLTSYVLLSLLEGKVPIPEEVISNAKYCINSQINPDKYTLAISSLALFSLNLRQEGNKMLNRLLNMANQQQNMLFWTSINGTEVTSDLETTSYVLLSLLLEGSKESLAKAHSIVLWVSTKLGPFGGFQSTQDTIITLEALTKYSLIAHNRRLSLKLQVKTPEESFNEIFSTESRLNSKIISLKPCNSIQITINGEGCLLVQSVLSYFVKELPHSQAFKLKMDVQPVSTIDHCSVTSLTPCLGYNGPDLVSNMAILEVTLPSGYQADRASLYELIELESSNVKMFEEIDNQVVLYLTKLQKQLVCFSFNINEVSSIENRKNSTIKLYDYYKPENEVVQWFSIEECSINRLVLPELQEKNALTRTKRYNDQFVDRNWTMETPKEDCGGVQVTIPINSTFN